MIKKYEVNKRILDEIKKYDANEKLKQFLLEILSFELHHIEERNYRSKIRFKEEYERIINTYCMDVSENSGTNCS